MTWIVILLLAALAAAALIAPVLRARRDSASRAAYDREIYRDQLGELERDRGRGLIDAAEAEAARAEIARRMLATERDEAAAPAKSALRPVALAAAAAAPVLAVALYAALGSPEIPGVPFAARVADSNANARAELTQRVAALAQRLQQNTEDLEGWTLLARSLTALERFNEAVTAWRQVGRLSGGAPEPTAALGETLVQAANGVVTPEARAAFERVRNTSPFDARSMFYIGLAEAQAGNGAAALQVWTDLVAVSPENAPWLPTLRERIRQTAAESRIDPASLKPSEAAQRFATTARAAPRGPVATDVEAMQRMAPEDRQKAIRGMVEGLAARLEAEPNDVEGWRRLGRARLVLGEIDKAKAAYAKAAALAPDRVEVLSDYAGALLEGVQGDALPPDFIAVLRRILAIDPDHGDALWFVGLAEAKAGNRDAAALMWTRLLGRLPPDSREYEEVKQRLEDLRAGK
ncbi:MAG TPA: c-type cytochrome biogenesis protein CcmI [Alphaproteobacteria bacterium]|nr:c-type cytochrome biogenesis protein CcmI [Alphaproteobacteria bacterium]